MGKKSARRAVAILLVVAVWPAFGLEERIVLGQEYGWAALPQRHAVVTQTGLRGHQDLVLDDRLPSRPADLYLSLDSLPLEVAGNYRLTSAGAARVIPTVARRGGASVSLQADGGLVLSPRPGALFAPGTLWGDVSIQFWLMPGTAESGQVILNWQSYAWRDEVAVPQQLLVTLQERRLVWAFTNLFRAPDGSLETVILTGVDGVLPGRWQHHELRFDSRVGLLEYLLDGRATALTHATDSGREGGTVRRPWIAPASQGNLVVGESFIGLIDDLGLSPTLQTPAALVRYPLGAGRVESRVFDLGSTSAVIRRMEATTSLPTTSAVLLWARVANTPVLTVADPWVPLAPGEPPQTTLRGRYAQLRADLLPGADGNSSPRVSQLQLVFEREPPPAPPIDVRLRPGDGQMTLTWAAVLQPGVAGYLLYFGTQPGRYTGSSSDGAVSPIDVGNTTEFRLGGLVNGQLYFFAVVAYDGNQPRQQSQFSAERFARPTPLGER